MDATTALTYAFLTLAALVCQLAERGGVSGRSGQPAVGLSLRDVSRALVAFVVVYAMLVGITEIAARGAGGSVGDGVLELVAGGLALLLMLAGWGRIPGLRGLRPGAPISWLALSLYLLTLAHNLAPASGRATVAATTAAPQSTAQLVVGAVPFAVLGVAAVGPWVRRPLPDTLRRLGLVPLRPWAWLLGIAVGVAAVKAGGQVYDLVNLLTPADCRSQQQRVFEHLAGPQRAWWGQLAVAGAAGIGEEVLFRGALQPRIGIILTSVLWASLHLQYTCHGLPSASNLYILLLGLLFGVVRRWWGLGAAITAHVAYDATILLFGA